MPETMTAGAITPSKPRFLTQEKLRFGDQDVQGHVNNSVYSTLFECSRVDFQTCGKCLTLDARQLVVIASITIDFRRELHWPATVEIRLGVSRIGRSSFGFMQELWTGDTMVATARSTQVVIDEITRRSTPLSQAQCDQLAHWIVES